MPWWPTRSLGFPGLSPSFAVRPTTTRVQTRPFPWLYRAHLASYPALDLLCAFAQDGLVPPWKDPSHRLGPRPTPANYSGANTGAALVTDKLLVDYYKGRVIIATYLRSSATRHFTRARSLWFLSTTNSCTWTTGLFTTCRRLTDSPSTRRQPRRLHPTRLGTLSSPSRAACVSSVDGTQGTRFTP
jgi:hypothetical protein